MYTGLALLFIFSSLSTVSAEYTGEVEESYPEIVYREDSNGDIVHYSKGTSETAIVNGYSAVFADSDGDRSMEIVARDQNSPYITSYARNGTKLGDLTGNSSKPKSSSLLGVCEMKSDGNLLSDVLFRDQDNMFAFIDAEGSTQWSLTNFRNPVGCADFDMDGHEEVLYVDDNSYLHWYNYESSDPENGTSSNIQQETVSSDRFGTVIHVDSDQNPEFVYPKEGIGIKAVDYQGETTTVSNAVTTFTGGPGHVIAPVEWDNDDEVEFAVSDGSQNIHIVDGSSSTSLGLQTYTDADLFSYIPPEIENITSEKVYGIDQNVEIFFEARDAEGYTDVVDNLTELQIDGPNSNRSIETERIGSGVPSDNSKDYRGLWNTDSAEEGTYQYNIEVRDEKGAGTVETGSFKIDLERPKWKNQGQEKDLVGPEEGNILKAKGFDSMNLSEAVLATNETGTFQNRTQSYRKSFSSDVGSAWANFSWNGSVTNETVDWRIYFKDRGGNVNSTEVQTFRVAGNDVEEVNITSMNQGSSISIFDRSGNLLSSENEDFSDRLETNRLYNLKISSTTSLGDLVAEPKSVNITGSLNVTSDVVESYQGEKPPSTDLITPIYAQEELKMDKETTTLTIPKEETSPNSIAHCTNWNFQTSECNSWEVNSTSDYAYTENSSHIQFNVSEFDAYGAGTTGPLPNITEIRVYDVTGRTDKRTGGILVEQGLDSDLNISQKEVNRSYRFEFQIRNDGLRDWSLETSDELFHQGLNSNWSVEDIWYELSQDNFTGGSVDSGQVSWDTGNGGLLEYDDTNDTMNASYVVNITQKNSKTFGQRFEVNDSSEEAGSYHEYTLDLKKFGFLDVDLTEPPSDTTVQKDSFFIMNATVECIEGECGRVSVSPRYNESTFADTLIPESNGRPFHTSGPSTVTCNSEDSLNGSCSHSWDVNASGPLDTEHLLDINASSSFAEVSSNDSKDNRVRIDNAVRINVTWNTIDFGVLDPGDTEQPAQDNSEGYNVSIPENSLDVDDLWVRSENMTTDGWKNPSTNESYVIPANNIFYNFSLNGYSVDGGSKEPLTNNYQHVISDLSSGSSISTYYWMNVPEGIKSSKYNGSIYFKANATN